MIKKLLKNILDVQENVKDTVREEIDSVFARDPAARNHLEVLLTYPGVQATMLHRVANELWQQDYKFFAKGISYGSRMLTGIEIHPAATIGKRFFIDHGMGVVIGETAEIGDDVTLYQGVTLGGVSLAKGKRHPTLEDGVVVGAGAKVLGPFTVGKNAKIGSNAVVVKAVPEEVTMVGNAARMIVKSKTQERKICDSENLSATDKQKLNLSKAFNAYGIDLDMQASVSDPIANAFTTMLEHIQQSEARIVELQKAVCQLDPNFCETKVKQLHVDEISVLKNNTIAK